MEKDVTEQRNSDISGCFNEQGVVYVALRYAVVYLFKEIFWKLKRKKTKT